MIGKNLRKSNLAVAFNILDDKNDEIRRRMALYCSKKVTCIIKRNNAMVMNNGDEYCLNCLHSFRTKRNL